MSRVEDRATYVIINAKSGTVMDLSGADNESGMYLHLQIDHWINSTMQLSDTQATAGRTSRTNEGWHLRNVDKGTYLAVGGEIRDDTRLIARDEPFTWHLWDDEQNRAAVRICVPDTQENVDLTNYGGLQDGTRIAIWGRWEPGENQTWFFEKVDN
ncbi:hypothetical protein D9619_008474 [Psilocybe cf. subviscida]|uniref:Ricin B lectin domain-containing protein n=1 Tax=Psilocybe cf. subviscida TaxID=2480587 RepID=A0A8H5BBI2_9AGAR|nr:hypothetical protein D9619_008474 [Psilocybe cf. subviscida]